jgi:hypothetical protein
MGAVVIERGACAERPEGRAQCQGRDGATKQGAQVLQPEVQGG